MLVTEAVARKCSAKKVFFKKSALVMNKLFISNLENYRKRQIG